MFLLPALGAWLSDSLILYIYFTNKGSSSGSNNGNITLYDAARIPCEHNNFDNNSSIPCRFQDSSFESKTNNNVIATFPNDIDDFIPAVQDNKQPGFTAYQYDIEIANDEDSSNSTKQIENDNNSSNEHKVSIPLSTIESKTGYVVILAIIRLLLLTFPLSYAAYKGTRVPCVIIQFLFQGTSLMIIISHMLAVLILDPMSDASQGDISDGSSDPFDPPRLLLSEVKNSGEGSTAWTLLSLSLVSIILHFFIVLHVRSTGPLHDGLYEEKRKRKRLAYAMAAQSNGVATTRGLSGGKIDTLTINGDHHNTDDDEDFADETPLLLPEGGSNNNNNLNRNKSFKERFMCLPDQYEAFMSDTQARFDSAQRMWAERLEIMTNNNNSTHGGSNSRDSSLQSSPTRNNSADSSNLLANAINNATKLVPLKPDPFKVLLQLFAYEDVWSGTNSRLDLAFGTNTSNGDAVSREGSAALSFYAPQLLSFLLHGAYFDISQKLEAWILKKCSQDLHFAHRCFWFLRSWCLGESSLEDKHKQSSHAHSLSSGGGSLGSSSLEQAELGPSQLRGVETNLYLSSCQGLIPSVPSFDFMGQDPPGHSAWNHYSGADGFGDYPTTKFTADEKALIEQLLQKVIQRGSRPAIVCQYGTLSGTVTDDYDSNDRLNGYSRSPSSLATAVERGLIPIDPKTGFQSTSHLDTITSEHKHGFLPLNNSGVPYQPPNSANEAASLFFAAPVFLDALLSVADDLMNVSRSDRTAELRKRLRGLEVELLPSNVVYLPIKNMQHRVWRIVSEESIALSTKERVPCIITLEVLDYGEPSSTTQLVNNESTITSDWVRQPRPPHRHSTLIDKVANYTQERLQDTIDLLSHHGDGRPGVLDRRLSDFLGRDSWKRSAHANDEDEETARELSEIQSYSPSNAEEEDDDDMVMQLPPPPLGGPLLSEEEEDVALNDTRAVPEPITPTKSNTLAQHDIEKSPMGQWSTPKKKLNLRKRNSFQNIAQEEEEISDEDNSPQGKQRRRVMFPPTSTSMARSESFGDEPRMKATVEPEDTNLLRTTAPAVVFKEDWTTKTERIRQSSIYGSNKNWRLLPILIKGNDDLRQEQLASQLISRMATILAKAKVPSWLYPYTIVALTGRGGIIECVPDTISIDSLKRNTPNFTSLKGFFKQHFGDPSSAEYSDAKANFVESLAAYSIVCFLMQIKDRHNGNILLHSKGHIIHIDWGFFFLSSPGKNSNFESAPFKLTRDFVDLMDGPSSYTFQKFRELCFKTFIELRKQESPR